MCSYYSLRWIKKKNGDSVLYLAVAMVNHGSRLHWRSLVFSTLHTHLTQGEQTQELIETTLISLSRRRKINPAFIIRLTQFAEPASSSPPQNNMGQNHTRQTLHALTWDHKYTLKCNKWVKSKINEGCNNWQIHFLS